MVQVMSTKMMVTVVFMASMSLPTVIRMVIVASMRIMCSWVMVVPVVITLVTIMI
jgi:hypothetical protein